MIRFPVTFALGLMFGGGVSLFFGTSEMRLASGADVQPQTMTAAELIANGPGDNGHIVLTDFWLLDAESVLEYADGNEMQFSRLWAPVITADDPYIDDNQLSAPDSPIPPYTGSVGLILYSTDINDAVEFFGVVQENSVQGLLINQVEKLDGRELELLRESLSIDAETVLILEHNRKPAGTGKVALMMGGGAVVFLAGPVLFFLGRRHAASSKLQHTIN